MKKIFFIFVAMVALFFAAGCKNGNDKNEFNIVTSSYPVYIMTLNIIDGTNTILSNISTPQGGCSHNHQLETDDMKKIECSSVFVINGLEPFVDTLYKLIPTLKIVDSSYKILLLKNKNHQILENSENEDFYEDDENNRHIWLSISNHITQVKNIAGGLANLNPQNAEKFNNNANSYIEKLEALKIKINEVMSAVKLRDVVTSHDFLPYFANEFDLNIADVINDEPDNAPSAKNIAKVVELMKKNNVKIILTEPQLTNDSVAAIAAETGAKVYEFDLAVSGDNTNKNAFLDVMEKNLKTLKEALN